MDFLIKRYLDRLIPRIKQLFQLKHASTISDNDILYFNFLYDRVIISFLKEKALI
jgi:hypothetical protein